MIPRFGRVRRLRSPGVRNPGLTHTENFGGICLGKLFSLDELAKFCHKISRHPKNGCLFGRISQINKYVREAEADVLRRLPSFLQNECLGRVRVKDFADTPGSLIPPPLFFS